ncbi:hypothetical protein RN001_007683 [Aquatica leii]|uniref:Gustatory receptor n=1 Tax=Aquatica leii TaxID=1421715 RepID=A0AAN7P8N3_9COLE|nr:hypothetical protein RN001_007683 [Aquatica leii]
MLAKLEKLLKEPHNIYEVIKPLQLICYIIGLGPYKVTYKNGFAMYDRSLWCLVRCAILFAVYSGVMAIHITRKEKFLGNDIEDYLKTLEEYFITLITLVSMVFACIFAQRIIDAFKNIDQVDREFQKLAVWMPYRRTHAVVVINVIVIILIGVIILIWILLVYPLGNIMMTTILEIATFLPFLLLTYFMESQYVQYVKLVYYRYSILNEHLEVLYRENTIIEGWIKEYNEDTNDVSKVSRSSLKSFKILSNPILVIDKVVGLHIKLSDTAYLINTAFSVQLLFRITIAFVTIVTALYTIGVNFSNPGQDSNTLKVDTMFTMWAVSSAIELFIIVHIANATCEEANKCPRLMHKIRNSTKNAKLQDKIEMYSLQMYHNRLKFYVCGLFPLDYTLLHTIVAGVTTYLVILVQFNTAGSITKKSKKLLSNST